MDNEAYLAGYMCKEALLPLPAPTELKGDLKPGMSNMQMKVRNNPFTRGVRDLFQLPSTVGDIKATLPAKLGGHEGGKPAEYAQNINYIQQPSAITAGKSLEQLMKEKDTLLPKIRDQFGSYVQQQATQGIKNQFGKYLPLLGLAGAGMAGMGMYNMYQNAQMQKQLQALMMQRAMMQNPAAQQQQAYRLSYG
jgi:hypothetical protein